VRECSVETRLRQRCRQEGFLCFKFVSPGVTGVPDRIILLHNGRVVFVELKAPGKRERARQKYVQECLRVYGFKVMSSVDSYDRVEEVIAVCREMELL